MSERERKREGERRERKRERRRERRVGREGRGGDMFLSFLAYELVVMLVMLTTLPQYIHHLSICYSAYTHTVAKHAPLLCVCVCVLVFVRKLSLWQYLPFVTHTLYNVPVCVLNKASPDIRIIMI